MSLTLTNGSEYTSEGGQTLLPDFKSDSFEVTLGVDGGSPRGTQVADLVEFFVLVQLSEERLPMNFDVAAKATYKAFGPLNNIFRTP